MRWAQHTSPPLRGKQVTQATFAKWMFRKFPFHKMHRLLPLGDFQSARGAFPHVSGFRVRSHCQGGERCRHPTPPPALNQCFPGRAGAQPGRQVTDVGSTHERQLWKGRGSQCRRLMGLQRCHRAGTPPRVLSQSKYDVHILSTVTVTYIIDVSVLGPKGC